MKRLFSWIKGNPGKSTTVGSAVAIVADAVGYTIDPAYSMILSLLLGG